MLMESVYYKTEINKKARNKELELLRKENTSLKEMHKVFRDIITKKDKCISNLQFLLTRGNKK